MELSKRGTGGLSTTPSWYFDFFSHSLGSRIISRSVLLADSKII